MEQVKAQLAEKAVQAAKAADEVLSGKEAMVKQLREEVNEARSVVQEETSSLQQAQANVNTAVQAAQQSQNQVNRKIGGRCLSGHWFIWT